MNTRAHVLIEQAAEESRREALPHDPAAASEESHRPPFREVAERVVPGVFFIPQAGPPIFLLLGPWLLLVLLIIPPAALLITLVLVTVVAAALIAAAGALIASPYLLWRHLRERPAREQPRFAFVRPATARRQIPITPGS